MLKPVSYTQADLEEAFHSLAAAQNVEAVLQQNGDRRHRGIQQGQPAAADQPARGDGNHQQQAHAARQPSAGRHHQHHQQNVGGDVCGELDLEFRPARPDAQNEQRRNHQVGISKALEAGARAFAEQVGLVEQDAGKYQRHCQGQAIQIEVIEAAPVRRVIALRGRTGQGSRRSAHFLPSCLCSGVQKKSPPE